MKKVFAILAVASMTAFVACGDGKDKEKEKADSTRRADSIAKIDADAKAAADSARMADSLAAAATADTTMVDTTAKQ